MILLIFDIDGTLTDTVPMYKQAFIDGLLRMGVQQMDTNFKEYLHHTDSYIGKVIYEADRQEAFTAAKIEAFEAHLTEIVMQAQIAEIAGAKKLMESLLADDEIAIGFATGSMLKPAEHKLEATAIPYRKGVLVAANHIHERENIVGQAIEQAKSFYHQTTFDRIISIGDGLWDLKTARNLGIEFIGIGQANKEIMESHGMKQYFDDLTEFSIHPPA